MNQHILSVKGIGALSVPISNMYPPLPSNTFLMPPCSLCS
jgi:hypothetical protein